MRCCRHCWLVLLVTMHLVLCFLRLSMSVAILQVQFLDKVNAVVVASGAFGQTARITVEIPQLQFLDKVVQISCRGAEADSHGLAVQQTTVILLLQFLDKVIDGPVVRVVQLPGGGPDVQKTVVFHSCSSCHVVDMPVVVHDRSWWCRRCSSSASDSVRRAV